MFKKNKTQVIGRLETVNFPNEGIYGIPAKIDTGAFTTSVWATDIVLEDGILSFKILGPDIKGYTGQEIKTKDFKKVVIHNSFGHSEKRFRVDMTMEMAGRKLKTKVNLSNRSLNTYPILIGRRTINGKFVVDVSKSKVKHANPKVR
jgi:hypothetical protein